MRNLLARIFAALRRTWIAVYDSAGRLARWILGMPEPGVDVEETEVVDETAEAAASEPELRMLPSPSLAERVREACAARCEGREWRGLLGGTDEDVYRRWVDALTLDECRIVAATGDDEVGDHLCGYRQIRGVAPVRVLRWLPPEPADDPVAALFGPPCRGKTKMPANLVADLEEAFAARRQR